MILSRMVFVAGLLCAIPVAADADAIRNYPRHSRPVAGWHAGWLDGLGWGHRTRPITC